MPILPLFFALGVWLLQQQAALPDLQWAWLLVSSPAFLLLPRRRLWQRIIRFTTIAAVACIAGFFHAA